MKDFFSCEIKHPMPRARCTRYSKMKASKSEPPSEIKMPKRPSKCRINSHSHKKHEQPCLGRQVEAKCHKEGNRRSAKIEREHRPPTEALGNRYGQRLGRSRRHSSSSRGFGNHTRPKGGIRGRAASAGSFSPEKPG